MAARTCPHCKTGVSARQVATCSNDVECPKCGTHLEVADGARTISSICGLAAGAIVWRFASGLNPEMGGDLSAVLPTLYAFLAYGIVSPLALMLTANLRNAPLIPVPEPAQTSSHAGHAAGGHDSGHH